MVFASLSEQAIDDSATGQALAQLLGAGGKGGGLGWWWHTTEDTLDKIDPTNLVRDAGVYAETLWRLCTVDRLPVEPAAAAEEMAMTLARYHTDARGALDLSGTEALAREAATAIAALSRTQHDPAVANALTIGLCRLLIPVNYTISGPFEHDLALGTHPIPGLHPAGRLGGLDRSSDEFYFLRTKLLRERNRVEQALRSALRLVETA
jgi:N-acetylated-alpha-linked acidic dipeptidase